MADSVVNPRVDAFLSQATRWRDEMAELRMILLGFPLTEEVKWGKPCYMFQKGIVAMIAPFKEYCALSFFKGALLKDAGGILVRAGENTQAARIIRFTGVQEIAEMEALLKAYIDEAIEVERAGLKVEHRESTALALPEELRGKFDEMPALKAAFDALTPGRRRAYVLYFSQPKQSKTRSARIEKYLQQIIDGKGLDDPSS